MSLDHLGRAVAEEQDDQLAARNDLALVRSRLLQRPAQRPSPMRWVAAGLAAAATIGLTLALWPRHQPIAFEVGSSPGSAGEWVATDDEAEVVRFSDGTQVELAPQSGVRVASLDEHGARLDLQRGSMRCEVKHRDENTSWRVNAGPFEVRVVGTTFGVTWHPEEERFSLHLEEGRVVVTGPTISQRSVQAGETVTVQLPERRVEIVQLDIVVPEHEEVVPSSDESIDDAPPAPSGRRRLRVDWRNLARQARHAEAAAAADWDYELATATAQDLLLLGDAARLSGSPERARNAYRGIRARFEDSPQSAQAAFLLGRLTMRGGGAAEAAAWFERALAEDPRGPYAQMAAGRLIEAYQRAGNEIAARRSAISYLERHPSGPHATLAQSLTSDHDPSGGWEAN